MNNWWIAAIVFLGIALLALVLRKPLQKQAYRLFFKWVLQDKDVPVKQAGEIQSDDQVYILDIRAPEEFEVSHLKGALRLGYEHKQWDLLDQIAKEDTILAYCTVGYRSQKVVKALREQGYENAYNLKGGLFEWIHQGRPIYRNGQQTKAVHTYNQSWGMWLCEGEKVVQ